jgi:hypothetical protein
MAGDPSVVLLDALLGLCAATEVASNKSPTNALKQMWDNENFIAATRLLQTHVGCINCKFSQV